MRRRAVKQMTEASQRFRRRVLAMLDARAAALEALWVSNDEIVTAKRTTKSIRESIGAMR